MKRQTFAAALVAASLGLGACACMQPNGSVAAAENQPVPGKVTDLAAFERFIAGQPTPEQFRARYPDVQLILPGTIATKEFRSDNSRYFPKLDTQGKITGGSFM
jgi:hypothetical protein